MRKLSARREVWGVSPFANDDAQDWLGTLSANLEAALLLTQLESAAEDEAQLRIHLACWELVAASVHQPAKDFPERMFPRKRLPHWTEGDLSRLRGLMNTLPVVSQRLTVYWQEGQLAEAQERHENLRSRLEKGLAGYRVKPAGRGVGGWLRRLFHN